MATATAAELILADVKIEDAGSSSKRLTIEIAGETVNERFNEAMTDLASQASLPGFRPGKAPRKLVERRFGKHLREDTQQRLLSDAYQKVITDENLKVLGDPVVPDVENLKLELDKPFRFNVEIEIFPEFEIPSFDDLEVRRPLVEADEKLIEQEIENQCNRHGEMQPLGDEEPGPGTLYFGKVTIYNLDDNPFESVATNPRGVTRWPKKDEDDPSGVIGGIKVDNLVELLKGKKVGDTISVETVGSENHEIAEIRGQNIRMDFSIEDLGQLIPASVEELATKLGCADEADLRLRLADALKAQIETEQREVMHRQVARYLMEKIDLDLPGRATAKQAERVLQSARLDMLRRNVPEYTIEERLTELREASDEKAKRDLKTHFIMEKLAEDYAINVEEPEINARIFQIARESGQRPDKVREEIIESGSVGVLISQLRHEKAADQVLEQVEIKDISVEEWNDLMKQEDESEESVGTKKKTGSTTTKKSSKKTTKKASTTKEPTTKKKTTEKKSSAKKSDGGD